MIKKINVFFIYMIILMTTFANANSFNIDNLSKMLFKGTEKGIYSDFTYYTLSKQNNVASQNYISSIHNATDINQKYQIRLSDFHYTVIRTSDNFIIDGNGDNGTIAQKSGTSICELLATDNSLYLNNFDSLYYSSFSKRLQTMKYNSDLVLFYTTVETYARKTSFFKANNFTVNHINDDFDEIFKNLLIEGNIAVDKVDVLTQEFSNMINYYAKINFGNDKNINNITTEEFKQIMFKIFTQIKQRMNLDGEFNPFIDTPHLLRVFDYSDEEIAENNKIIEEKYSRYIKEYLLKKTVNDVYLSFNKNIYDFHNFIHNSNNGFNYGISYNIEHNTNNANNKVFNIINIYEKELNKNLSTGIGLNFAKYNFNDSSIHFNNMLYFKIKNNILSSDIGLHYGKLLNSGSNKNSLVNFKFNNHIYGYFIRLYKYLNINTRIVKDIELSSSYFNSIYKISDINSKNSVSNKMNKFKSINFSDNYVYTIIGLDLSEFSIKNKLINYSFGIKNIVNLNNNYINKNNKYINHMFIKNNINIKNNNNLSISVDANTKNIKDFNCNILFTSNI